MDTWSHFLKPDWDRARERHAAWWRQEGMVLHVLARRADTPASTGNTQAPFYYLMAGLDTTASYTSADDLRAAWVDAGPRAARAAANLSTIYYGGDSFPYFDTHLGPGSLALFLGSEPDFALDTVWFHPCITDPDSHPPLTFDPRHPWFVAQKALLEAGVAHSGGRFLVGIPDLIENVDILAALRGAETLMLDFIERPDFIHQRVEEINQVYFAAYDALFDIARDPWGGSAFSAFGIWGPGRTAKVQCDLAALISPRMFNRFVVPALSRQCDWLDNAMYHLDGTQAMVHLDALLSIDSLDAIEWTPQVNVEQGGHPRWYPLYRRILDAGKSVQVINVQLDEVFPLLDAIGTKGVFVMVNLDSEAEARTLVEAVEQRYG